MAPPMPLEEGPAVVFNEIVLVALVILSIEGSPTS